MISGIFHKGSGLGDQLHRYVTVRTLAEEKGFTWGMIHPEHFKGTSFMHLDMGEPVPFSITGEARMHYELDHVFNEHDIRDINGTDIRSYDPEINFIEDNTVIDGYFEDNKYWGHNLHNIDTWLKVEPATLPDTTCAIGFRGGEYAAVPELFLTDDYWDAAIKQMKVNGITDFVVETDDPETAYKTLKQLVPEDTYYVKDIGINWRVMRYAKHAIIANSAFYIMPRHLAHHTNKDSITIAPRYWARRNPKTWARPACYYKQFQYV